MLHQVAPDISFAFFIYEGNDFKVRDEAADKKTAERGFEERYDSFRNTFLETLCPGCNSTKLIYKMSRRLERSVFPYASQSVILKTIKSEPVGFYTKQTADASAESLDLDLDFTEPVWNRTRCVFFIPTKARVYDQYFKEAAYRRLHDEPSVGFNVLKQALSKWPLEVVDLTPILKAQASRLEKESKFVFWRDDTHWNGFGIKAVISLG